jgi:hypothetical protein
MFAVFYTIKIVYICVFIIVPYPIALVTHLWIRGMYVCNMCVCVCLHGPSTGDGQIMETVVKGTHFIVNMELGSHLSLIQLLCFLE